MNKKVRKKLMDLGAQIPQELLDKVHVTKESTPTMKMVAEKALESDDVRPEIKEGMKDILDSGRLDRTYTEVDKKTAKKIDKWMEKEVKRMIKSGELPDPKTDIKTKQWIKKMWKGQKKASESKSKTES